ncbi:glutathione-disulfide reductase [Nodularia spumigena CS-584]|jgi:glutathione reductase (NADPH)|uniref:Glutathione reductase n=1 Tax=Nodularia spumigena UHCC 0060 TaxID=3110300 RepID=A0ABU5URM0_NODSP|nr:glutathione-disulfide reductase [Nodularia spumigena]AHJ31125.1 Glutathione reductase [Nodularia spumigena CCY9414]EAW45599.1 glutathione reductase [Nodularia spumigena CCY9414]MDB9383934.1 glutathione-disulfide reductase [Nodularia spumigena CS-584]MEA5527120.1 glutathione-disulfide reductase [Nodularia spumigena UHCC 0143]MEA5608915.1 glutathione-disulfide reductase [Nodularia spumigena UHCC 0060]
MSYDFDLFVIGAGSGGIATARRAAEYGAKVGVAEFDRLGGTCVNRGCVPKKLMVYASHFPELLADSQGYGWSAVKSSLDWEKMITAVNNEVTRLNGIYKGMLDKSKVEILEGYGTFIDAHTVKVGDRQVTADKILIAVGGYPVKPNIPGIEYAITSDDIFHLKEQPQRLVILGGGYIGSEFACILNGLGSDVTQIIRNDKILRGFDEDLQTEIQQAMGNHGIKILNNSEITGIEKTDSGLKVTVRNNDDAEETVIVDAVSLAATGRKPNTQKLGLENTKVQLDKNGAVIVDKYSQTSEENIYALGDCTDNINLTPVAINEGRALADTVFGNKSRTMSYENIPTAIFTTPEAATVGMTEAEARAEYGDAVKVYRSRFRPMYYTLAGKDEKTMMKLVVDQNTDKVVGAHMVGTSAAEIIQGVAIAVKMGATKANFDATVGIHPSSAEEFVTMR